LRIERKILYFLLLFSILLFSCSSQRFEFESCEISINNLSGKEIQDAQIEVVWLAQRKSFLGTYIQEVSKNSEPVENGKGRIPSISLPYSDVMLGVFLKSSDGSFPLGFFSDKIEKSGVLPLRLLQSNLTLNIEEFGGIEGKIFLTAEERAEDIGLQVRISDSMNPPSEIVWWFPLERNRWNKIELERKPFPYLLLEGKIFKVSAKIKFCRTRYGMRIMEEREIFEKDFSEFLEAEEALKKELKEIKFNLKI